MTRCRRVFGVWAVPVLGPKTALMLVAIGYLALSSKHALNGELVEQLVKISGRPRKLVANLPYSVASPILVELAQGERSPRRIVATLQLEVAKRLMARARTFVAGTSEGSPSATFAIFSTRV